jgi:hypothetical protein
VSDPVPATPSSQRHVLRAAPPVRPLAIGAGLVVVGAALLVLWRAAALPAGLAVVGGLLMLLGVLLAVAGLVVAARLRTEVVLDDSSITVIRSGEQRSLTWSEVQKVTLSHPRLVVRAEDPTKTLSVVNPRAAQDSRFLALLRQIQHQLDTNRGYRNL